MGITRAAELVGFASPGSLQQSVDVGLVTGYLDAAAENALRVMQLERELKEAKQAAEDSTAKPYMLHLTPGQHARATQALELVGLEMVPLSAPEFDVDGDTAEASSPLQRRRSLRRAST